MGVFYKESGGSVQQLAKPMINGVPHNAVYHDGTELRTVWGGGEEFVLNINTKQTNSGTSGTETTFSIPTSGAYSYNWKINWGDGNVETASGTGSSTSAGISHTYTTAGAYVITIKPNSGTDAWFRAFGFYGNTSGANAQENKNKVVSPNSPLTPQMFFTALEISAGGSTSVNGIGFFMFYGCRGAGFTMGSSFGFSDAWSSITSVGGTFCASMFQLCYGSSFNMNSGFNLPQGLTTVGNNFCATMFQDCHGSVFTMNSVFNLPPTLMTVGTYFCSSMFGLCSGSVFAMNSGFNLPQGLTTVGNGFCNEMFTNCTGSSFVVNSVFKFPRLSTSEINKEDVFYSTFFATSAVQSRTAESIINDCAYPSDLRETFGGTESVAVAAWSDLGAALSPVGYNWHGFSSRGTEFFVLNINTKQTNSGTSGTETTFSIPTNNAYSYYWKINWGDGTAAQTASGTGSSTSVGISHTYTTAGAYRITIRPTSSAYAWFRAYGFKNASVETVSGGPLQSNRNKIVSVNSALTPQMVFTSAQITAYGGTGVHEIFYGLCAFCKGYGFTMGSSFGFSSSWNSIKYVGDDCFASMFNGCSGNSFTMVSGFNLPTGLTTVGGDFCYAMFSECCGSSFTMVSGFNLPTGITSAGEYFASYMFYYATGRSFNMNSVFTISQSITTVSGNYFCARMFRECTGSSFTMNSVIKLPPNLASCGQFFCYEMFYGCSNNKFNMGAAFNVPQTITSAPSYLLYSMFSGCVGTGFLVNSVFKFPPITNITTATLPFYRTFYAGSATTVVQTRTITSIVNGLTPNGSTGTFTSTTTTRWSDYGSVSSYWK